MTALLTSRLSGRTAFINGGARGIGRASALRLAAEGAKVWITSRDESAMAEAIAEAREHGLTLNGLSMDSSDANSIQRTIDRVYASDGRLDILVNNAGGSLQTPALFEQESDEDWKRVLDLNIMGTVWACRRALPLMKAAGQGRIVNVGSKAGRFSSRVAGANYAASKGAISALTRQLAAEYGPSGITVNCVCPGLVMTARTKARWETRKTPQERALLLESIPLRRHAEPQDVSGAIAFLASDDAAFITGITLDVNGGEVMA
jgi:3-oxoacyl-[acyl-carrier protein] reductase/2-hydroxycyclohexanecarboxyl-CoA dehydrogenase